MRRLLVAVLACVALALAGCTASPGAAPEDEPAKSNVAVDTPQLRALKKQAGVAACAPGTGSSKLPELTLACLGGGPAVQLSKLRGPLVVNLFAQWCGPCRSELPYYQQLHEKAGGKLGVIGVDYLDVRPDLALQLVRKTGVTYPLLADPDATLRPAYRIQGLPGILLVAADGTVTFLPQVVRSYAELRGLVEKHLGVTVPS